MALRDVPQESVDLSQAAAAWSVHSMALQYSAVAQCLNDALRNASDEASTRIGRLFNEKERKDCFDAGVMMRLGVLCPAERH